MENEEVKIEAETIEEVDEVEEVEEVDEEVDEEEVDETEEVEEVDEEADDEEVEMEIDEDAIVAYLVDEDDVEIGFTMIDEDGNEVEYYYTEEQLEEDAAERAAQEAAKKKKKSKFDALSDTITREQVKNTATDMNAIYRDGAEIAREFKGVYDDIRGAFDFSNIGKPAAASEQAAATAPSTASKVAQGARSSASAVHLPAGMPSVPPME